MLQRGFERGTSTDFPDHAAEALRSSKLCADLAEADLWRWCAAGQARVAVDSDTQLVVIRLFTGDDVIIEAYVRSAVSDPIHDHITNGAIGIVRGRNFAARYAWSSDDDAYGVQTGQLTLTRVGVSRAGDVHVVQAGSGFIHQVIHLRFPALTLAARSRLAATDEVQHEYFRAGLAVPNARSLDADVRGQMTALAYLATQAPRDDKAITALLRHDEPAAEFHLLRTYVQCTDSLPEALALVEPRPWHAAFASAYAAQEDWCNAQTASDRLLRALTGAAPDTQTLVSWMTRFGLQS